MNSEAGRKRMHNIQWIFNLPKEELQFRSEVEQVLIHKTRQGEELVIQYPGKESMRTQDEKRPHDFIPRIITENGYFNNINKFWDIWRLLFEQLEPRKEILQQEIRGLAVVFYRMAFMVDHNPVDYSGRVKQIRIVDKDCETEISSNEKRLGSLYLYQPPQLVIDCFSDTINCGGISFEAFLHFNNILAWNEDCKYYYRAQLAEKPWMGAVGRINNLLTHICVLGNLLGDLKTFDVFYKFSTGKGVAPVSSKEVQTISGGLVYK
ncbi:hypothetical protein ACFLXH_00960 [Chloroflexota bacterium]